MALLSDVLPVRICVYKLAEVRFETVWLDLRRTLHIIQKDSIIYDSRRARTTVVMGIALILEGLSGSY